MKKWEKEILLNKTKDELNVLRRLEKTYNYALDEVKQKVAVLQAKPQTQSVIYQLKYQNELKKQLQEVYNNLYLNSYSTIEQYLKESYEDSFFYTMYGLHQQNVPLIIPFPQEEVAQMTSVAADGIKLSQKIYTNTTNLARISREEISRGLATGASYIDIARTLENRSNITYNQAKRIVETEAHRIQEEVQYKTLQKAKDKGADIVKQWDCTLDKRTRKTHIELDGQTRELDQPFKIPSTGATAQYPGGFGIAKEDIRCRCVSLQRARWALDKSEVKKIVGDIDGMDEEKLQAMAGKLGVDPSDLKNAQNNYITAKNYNDFKKKYQTKVKVQTAKQAAQAQVQNQTIDDPYSAQRKANAFEWDYRADADKYYRPKLDAEWDNLPDKEKYAIWQYTENSNPINKSLSGYHDGWRRYNFIGVQNTEWGHEDSWRSIPSSFSKFGSKGHVTYKKVVTDLTKAIDSTTIDDDVFLVRGSDNGGFAGLLESIMPFDDAKDYLDNGDITSLKALVVGNTVKNHAFTSTGIAKDGGFGGSVKYKIYAPKGTKGIYAEPQSYYGLTVGSNARLYKTGEYYSGVGSEAEVILQRGTEYRVTKIDYSYGNYTVEMEVVNQPNYFKYGDEDTFNNGLTRHSK